MTHPMVEEAVVRGRVTYEWLEGGRFLIERAANEHPDFPDALCVIGVMEDENDLSIQYFASRGVVPACVGPPEGGRIEPHHRRLITSPRIVGDRRMADGRDNPVVFESV